MGWLDLMQMMPLFPAGGYGGALLGRMATDFVSQSRPPVPRVPDSFVGDYEYYDDGTSVYRGGASDPYARYFDDAGYYNGGDVDYQPSIPLPPESYDFGVPSIQDEPDFL